MEKKDINKIIIGSIVTLVGVLGGFATFLSMPEEYRIVKIIFISLSILLLAIACILFLSSFFDLKNAFHILRITKKLGIIKIKTNGISDNDLGEMLSKAKNIKIISSSALIFFRTREDEFVKALENNARISVIIATPNSDFVKETEIIEGRKNGEINNEIEQVLSILFRFEQESKKKTNNQSNGIINIKHFKTQLKLPMIIVDDSYVWLTLTFPPKRSTQSPSFAVTKVKNGILDNCVKHFDELWAQLESKNEITNIDVDSFIGGKWKLDWYNQTGNGSEYLEIKERKYYVNDVHCFNIDQLEFDYSNKKISFRKVAVKENDNRILINVLTIENDNKLIGIESGIIKLIYYRV